MPEFTIDALVSQLRESAGEDESVELDGDILDITFEALGYDSLALFNTASAIERDCGIELSDEALGGAKTPRDLLQVVNDSLAAKA